jgi:hypothetical protein
MHGAAGLEYAPLMRLLCAAAALSIALNVSVPAQSRRGADARNMELVGHNDLNGGGDGGEGSRCICGRTGDESSIWRTKLPTVA